MMSEINGEKNDGQKDLPSSEQQREIAAVYNNGRLVRIFVIAVGVIVFLCVVFYVLSTSRACEQNAIEVIEEPKLVALPIGVGLSPAVKVEVRNRSDKAIKVKFECVVYDANGKKSTTVSSPYELLMPGDTATLRGTSADSYPLSQYLDKCASISELNYRISG